MSTRREMISLLTAGATLAASGASAQEAPQPAEPDGPPLRIVGLEEHVVLPPLQNAWARVPGLELGFSLGFGDSPNARKLRDVGDERLADMADQGVDMQVLAASSPGVQNLSAREAPIVARDFNDALAAVVAGRPDRFQAFAAIPTPAPEAAAAELERAVSRHGFVGAMLYGRTGEVKPEDRVFDDLYATAARLGVPLYFHPQRIVAPVQDAYYKGIDPRFDAIFASAGLGWYYDLGVQVLRMIYTGVFDRHPDLQIVLGHWGEVVLFYLDHVGYLDLSAKVERPLLDYFRRNIWITNSGTQSPRYLRWAAEVVGPERLLYATDYPFTFRSGDPIIETSGGRARTFLDEAPFTAGQKAAIGAGNWRGLIAPVSRAFD